MHPVCPHCGGDRLRRLEAIWEEQTGDTRTGGFATSFSFRHGTTNHCISSRSRTSSQLAQKIAPPTKKTADWIVWAAITIFFIGLPLDTSIVRNLAKGTGLPQNVTDAIVITSNLGIIFVVIPAIFVVGGHRVWRYNRRVYPRLMETWLKSWRCERCGGIWASD